MDAFGIFSRSLLIYFFIADMSSTVDAMKGHTRRMKSFNSSRRISSVPLASWRNRTK
jgi:hypothetical protein